jgi:hypothetical protein
MFKQGRLNIISEVEKLEPPKEVKIIKEGAEKKANEPIKTDGPLEFDSLKALQVYLVKNHKISFSEIRSRENALSKAEELNLKVKING